MIGEADFIVDDHDDILVQQSVRCRCFARSTVYRLIPGEAEGFGTAPAGVVRCPHQRSCLPCVRCNVDQVTSPVLIQVPQQRSDDLGFTGTYIRNMQCTRFIQLVTGKQTSGRVIFRLPCYIFTQCLALTHRHFRVQTLLVAARPFLHRCASAKCP